MKTQSWSAIARKGFDRLYNNYLDAKDKEAYKKYVFEELFSPLHNGIYVDYWLSPLIQRRIAKKWKRVVDKQKKM